MAPHELTQAQFKSQAIVTALKNHGRKWSVTLSGYSAFSDAASADEAMVDVHHGAVNNALYMNCEAGFKIEPMPSMPPREVTATYPDLVAKFKPAAFDLDDLCDLSDSVANLISDKRDYCANEEGVDEQIDRLNLLAKKLFHIEYFLSFGTAQGQR